MFTAKTTQSGKLKAIFELLYANTQTVCLTIDESGISAEHITTNNSIININLPSTGFDEYTFTFKEPQFIGIGSQVNAFFKGLKNKTTIELSMVKSMIDESTPTILKIVVASKDLDYEIEHNETVTDAQNVASSVTHVYDCDKVSITTANFNSLCKYLMKTSTVFISKESGTIMFRFGLVGVSERKLNYGIKNSEDKFLFSNIIQADSICRVIKLAAFASKFVELYLEQDKPLMLKSTCELGTICVYIQI
jgi:hypothetical protein